MYFMMSPSFQDLLLTNATGMTAKGIKAAKLKRLSLSVPPREEQDRIVQCVAHLLSICGELESSLKTANLAAKRLATAMNESMTGIHIEEEEKLKVPKTQLVSMLRIGVSPSTKEQAPLATIMAHHNNEMEARDLWQRYGGEIDAFYRQLKIEVEKGWIIEPEVAEMREVEAG